MGLDSRRWEDRPRRGAPARPDRAMGPNPRLLPDTMPTDTAPSPRQPTSARYKGPTVVERRHSREGMRSLTFA